MSNDSESYFDAKSSEFDSLLTAIEMGSVQSSHESPPQKDASTASFTDAVSGEHVPIETVDANFSSSDSPLIISPSMGSGDTQNSADQMRNSNQQQHAIDYALRAEEPPNQALVFIKPHANTKKVRSLVSSKLLENINPFEDNEGGGRIVAEFDIPSDHIESAGLIDAHYRALATNAMKILGRDIKVSAEKFKKLYGEDLHTVKKEKRIYNAAEALSVLGCTPEDLEKAWREAEADECESRGGRRRIHRLGSGFYCGNLTINDRNAYIINGFYMAMREKYVAEGASIHAYIIQWNESILSWKDFRKKVIGSTNPANAEKGTLRNIIFEKFEALGLAEQPNTGNNAIHASASPLEGLAERCNWCSQEIGQDQFGMMLLGKGIPESSIIDWCDNAQVQLPTKSAKSSYKMEKVFDVVEDLSSLECVEKLVGIYDYELFADENVPQRSRCRGGYCCAIS